MGWESAGTRTDGWVETEATILWCRQTAMSSLRSSMVTSDGFLEVPEYRVGFEYRTGSRAYTGTYVAHSAQNIGSTLTIAYDPRRPDRNTAGSSRGAPWLRIAAWAIGLGLAALVAWSGFPRCLPF